MEININFKDICWISLVALSITSSQLMNSHRAITTELTLSLDERRCRRFTHIPAELRVLRLKFPFETIPLDCCANNEATEATALVLFARAH